MSLHFAGAYVIYKQKINNVFVRIIRLYVTKCKVHCVQSIQLTGCPCNYVFVNDGNIQNHESNACTILCIVILNGCNNRCDENIIDKKFKQTKKY